MPALDETMAEESPHGAARFASAELRGESGLLALANVTKSIRSSS